jgi:fatty-acyl-CoA synthase
MLDRWKVVIGGSALPRGLAEAALARGINVFSAYGLSETCPLLTTVHLDPADESDVGARLKTGRPAAMVELRVVDAEMRDVPRDGVSTGEIVARAPWLNDAYLKDENATAALWRGGYLHTGDVGRMEANGSLMITDRLKDVIKSGGEWISSLTLESVASAVIGVAEVAAIGIPDPKWGERPLLLVVPEEGVAPDTLPTDITAALEAEIAAGALSKWALPERIDIVADLARTSVGKIDKKRLRAMVTPG